MLMAFFITSILCFSISPLRPAPLPVTSEGSLPSSTDVTAEAVVVFPMPISPVRIISWPSLTKAPTVSMLLSSILIHSSLVIAGPLAIFPLPYDSFILFIFSTSLTIPASMGRTFTPALLAIIQAADSPRRKLLAAMAVTSFPHWDIPSSTTPLSAHIITSTLFSKVKSQLPLMPAICVITFSSLPRENSGLTSVSHFSSDFFTASVSISLICFIASSSFINTPTFQ